MELSNQLSKDSDCLQRAEQPTFKSFMKILKSSAYFTNMLSKIAFENVAKLSKADMEYRLSKATLKLSKVLY